MSAAYAQSRLDLSYFGLEFKDSREAVQISWIDPASSWARRLNVDDVVLKAGNLQFNNASDLTQQLQQQPNETIVRLEVIALRDKEPRTVNVRSKRLRDVVAKRFTKERDRDAKEILYLPEYPAELFFIVVTEDFDGGKIGLRVRYYPRSQLATAAGDLMFWRAGTPPMSHLGKKVATSETEYHLPNISEEEAKKIPILNGPQLRRLQSTAYVELGSDRTQELLTILESPANEPGIVGYNGRDAFPPTSHLLTDGEKRNLKSCLLLYEILMQSTRNPSP